MGLNQPWGVRRDSHLIPFGNLLSVPVHYKRNQAQIVYSVSSYVLMFTVHSLECCVHKHCCCLCSAHTALTYFLLWKICCSDSEGEAAVCKPPFSSDWLLEVEEYNRDYKKSCKVFSQITNSSIKLSSRSGLFAQSVIAQVKKHTLWAASLVLYWDLTELNTKYR